MVKIYTYGEVIFKLFFLFFFFLYHLTVFADQSLTVVIDPGHGGKDSGAVRGDLREADIVLSISKKLKTYLEKDNRFYPILTRSKDISLTLEQRAEVAKNLKRGVFLSLHINASEDPKAHGVEFYFQNQLPPDEESQFLANRENQMSESISLKEEQNKKFAPKSDVLSIIEDLSRNHKIYLSAQLGESLLTKWLPSPLLPRPIPLRQAPYFLVTNLSIPSILIELGFISHKKEFVLLDLHESHDQFAKSLVKGLINYKERLDKVNYFNLNSSL